MRSEEEIKKKIKQLDALKVFETEAGRIRRNPYVHHWKKALEWVLGDR